MGFTDACPLQLDSEMGGRVGQSKDKLEPRMVDAYWLQRETNKFMNDPLVSERGCIVSKQASMSCVTCFCTCIC